MNEMSELRPQIDMNKYKFKTRLDPGETVPRESRRFAVSQS